MFFKELKRNLKVMRYFPQSRVHIPMSYLWWILGHTVLTTVIIPIAVMIGVNRLLQAIGEYIHTRIYLNFTKPWVTWINAHTNAHIKIFHTKVTREEVIDRVGGTPWR